MVCLASPLLRPGMDQILLSHLVLYESRYDEVFNAVHTRITEQGAATKTDLAALIFWKHINNSPWMTSLNAKSDAAVRAATAEAFKPGLTDRERLDVLAGLPGCGVGQAVSSVILAAFTQRSTASTTNSHWGLPTVVDPACQCERTETVVYFEHLRLIASELNSSGGSWTPRMVDVALFKLGGG
jgi:hypothetical protein